MDVKQKPAALSRGDAILRRLPDVAKGVEVGVFKGVLSGYLLKRRPHLRLFMVDNWAPSAAQADHYRATGDYAAHLSSEEANANLVAASIVARRAGPRARILKMNSIAAAQLIDARSLDFVFLDADHSYDGVREDIAAWLPKVKPGGWIGGHDYDNDTVPGMDFSGVARAVNEWASGEGLIVETDENFTWFVPL